MTIPAAPPGLRPATGYLPRLESLRGVAILLVMLFHADRLLLPELPTGEEPLLATAFVHGGHTGVTLFFVLSAFLLSRPFLREALGGPRPGLLRFWQRRALRILPLYWVVVVASSLLHGLVQQGRIGVEDVVRALPFAVFLNSVPNVAVPMFPWSDVWWSLATEAQFYVALPLAAFVARWRAGRWLLGAGLGAYAIAYAFAVADGSMVVRQQAFDLFGRLPAFLAGILIAWTHERHGAGLRAQLASTPWRRGGADLLLVAVLAVLALLLRHVTHLGFFEAENDWHAWHVAEAGCWAFVVLWVLTAPAAIGAALDSRPLQRLGLLSYSLYLVHMPILFFTLFSLRPAFPELQQGWNAVSVGWVGVCIAAALVLSEITYRSIERPFLRRKAAIGLVAA